MNTYKLILAYDGTHFLGWQKTKTGPSIQGSLQAALRQITQEEILPEAASRTDRGVHASGQVVSFSLSREWLPQKLQLALNAALQKEIRVMALNQVSMNFHPTLNAVEKEYHYLTSIAAVQDPTLRLYSWAFRFPLCLDRMKQGAAFLVGKNDFSAFSNTFSERPICSLKKIEILSSNEMVKIVIVGDRFLYKMVRNLVGTLLYVGCGKIDPEKVPLILASKDRKQAAVTAPAHGLTLYRVRYER